MTIVRFRVLDLETGGRTPPASVVEIGSTDVVWDSDTRESQIFPITPVLFRPTVPMEPDAIATHHLTEAMLEDFQPCSDFFLKLHALDGDPDFLVAANAEFEQQWFTPEIVGDIRWICTVKAAAVIYEPAPSKSNQCIRYYLGLDLDPALAMPPHRAGPDSYVTACILAEMLKTEKVADLALWTLKPRYLPTIPSGKHKGTRWTAIDFGFLEWVLKAQDIGEDWKYAAQQEVDRRRAAAAGR